MQALYVFVSCGEVHYCFYLQGEVLMTPDNFVLLPYLSYTKNSIKDLSLSPELDPLSL